MLAFGAAQVQADEQKLPSGTPYDQIGQKIENYYQKHEKQPVCSLCLVALATPDLWAYFVYHAATFLLYPKRPKT
ncbi:hypothetical protein HMPREF9418_1119 [Neisseria macacae ATCC 33926]|uniref:Uncharacterized protein n=1 Tax=Neisseria macacae ATCC 33926 TaxID=997348 RepID=A0AA36XKT5_9NEIS|nr:hypothetical protein HMPREF9418_1119 [Neisseria macacae ATCC 33926]